jgi:hypothetical protein
VEAEEFAIPLIAFDDSDCGSDVRLPGVRPQDFSA